MLERGVECVGKEAQRCDRKGARAARRIADGQRQDVFRRFGRPASGRSGRVRGTVGVSGRIVGQRAQGAMHRGHRESGAGVEAARSLAGAAPAHEIPLAGQNYAGDELLRPRGEFALLGEPAFGRVPGVPPPSRFPHESRRLRRPARPRSGPPMASAGARRRVVPRFRLRAPPPPRPVRRRRLRLPAPPPRPRRPPLWPDPSSGSRTAP